MEQYHSDALWWARPVESTRNQNWETCRLFPSKEGSDVCSPRKLEWMLSNNLVTLCYPTESAFTQFQIPQYPKQSSQSVEPIFMLSTDRPPRPLSRMLFLPVERILVLMVTGALLKRCTLQGNFDATKPKVLL